MLIFIQTAQHETNPLVGKIIIGLVVLSFVGFGVWQLLLFIESFWVEVIRRKPLFRHLYFKKKKLSLKQLHILKTEFSFYNKLSKREKRFFEHRVVNFIKRNTFEGKQGVQINDTIKVLISATGVMLTFGYRYYKINSLNHFVVYPKAFYSNINKALHKGEFNPSYGAIIFSWEDFLHGYDISNDNFNLGIHEMVHAMHFYYLQENNHSVNAVIFMNTYNELRAFLDSDNIYKDKLVASKYLRDYAYTNQFEFVAVLIESFLETPAEFRTQFPEMYDYVKQMLNFNFAGY